MAYFVLSTGLRGCYMPDSARVIEVRTRAALREIVKQEADYQKGDLGDLRYIGLSDRAQSAFVREAWARRKDPRWTKDLALPFGERGNVGSHGIFLARATRDDYVNQGEDW